MINTDELKHIGRYRLKEKVGEGAMGVVYKAYDPNLGIDVAIKILRIELAEDQCYVERFLQEAKVIARLSHPSIVHVYNMDKDRGSFYIAMKFLEGKPLNHYIQENRPDLSRIIDIAIQIADALDCAHKNKVIHRDIKPSNIIVSDEGQVTLTDFGVARLEGTMIAVQTMAGDKIGTPLYMAPEQIEGAPIDGRTDLYALGIVLYEMATHERPFASFNRAIKPKPPAKINPAIPKSFSCLIMKSLEYKPEKRFQTGRDMVAALKSMELMPSWRTKIIHCGTPKKQRYILVGCGVAVCVLIAFVVIEFKQPPVPQKVPPIVIKEGLLTIDSIPPGADIVIDEQMKGKTSDTFKLPVGSHHIRLELDRYYEGNVTVEVDEGETSLRYRLLSMDKKAW